jgi:hypothetical protein
MFDVSSGHGRRQLLLAGGALAVVSCEGFASVVFGDVVQARQQFLTDFFRTPEQARALGRDYLARFPAAADPTVLTARLTDDGRVADHSAFRAHFTALRERDFAHHRTVEIDGWVFALCEAQLCTLVCLT